MMRKKGQAVIEFMSTYGWAIMMVTLSIGALAYFQLSNPTRTLSARCGSGPGFNCLGASINNTFTIFYIENKLGESVKNVQVTMNSNISCSANTTWPFDSKQLVSCNTTSLALNGNVRLKYYVVFQKSKSSYNQTISGDIYGKT